MGPARAGGVIDREGNKFTFEECKLNPIEWVHEAAWNPEARLALMDECGVYAQVLYPNAVGIGGQQLARRTHDETLPTTRNPIYNDFIPEGEQSSPHPMPPMPNP